MSFSLTFHFKLFLFWSFLRVFFFNILFQLPHVISSNQLPSVFPVHYSCRIFPIRAQLFCLYNLYHMSYCQSSSFDCFSAFSFQFLYENVSYFPNSVLLIALMSCTPTVKFPIFSLSCLFWFSFSSFRRSFDVMHYFVTLFFSTIL